MVGQDVVVRGVIVQVGHSGRGTTFLNFGAPYPGQVFTAVVFDASRPEFSFLEALEGRTVTVSGPVQSYKGRPEIIVSSPSQIGLQ